MALPFSCRMTAAGAACPWVEALPFKGNSSAALSQLWNGRSTLSWPFLKTAAAIPLLFLWRPAVSWPVLASVRNLLPPQFRVDVGRRMALNEQRFPTGEYLPLQGEELSIPLGVRPQGRAIQGLYTAAGHTAQVGDILYRVSENFDRWLLWNGDGRQGFCTIGPLQGGGKPGTPLWLEPGGCIVFEAAFCYAENRAGGRPCTLYISNGSQRGGPGAPTGGKHYRRCPPPAGSRTYL